MTSHPADWWGAPGCYPVSEGLYRIPLSMPNDGLRAVNIYALVTDDALVLVDGGWAVASAWAELESALRLIGRSPHDVSDIFVTHVHRDHYTFGVRLREKYGTKLHLGRHEKPGLLAIQDLQSNIPQASIRELNRAGAANLGVAIAELTASEPFDAADWESPDSWLEEGPLPIAGWSLEAVHTPGHTKGHLVFHDQHRGLIFTGDHVLPTITPSIGFELGPWDLPLKNYLESLQLLLERPDAEMLPAHGFSGGSVHQRVEELLLHHAERFDEVTHIVRSGARKLTGFDVAQELKWTRRRVAFAELNTFNKMIAVCEAQAHLDVMVHRGDLSSQFAGDVELFAIV